MQNTNNNKLGNDIDIWLNVYVNFVINGIIHFTTNWVKKDSNFTYVWCTYLYHFFKSIFILLSATQVCCGDSKPPELTDLVFHKGQQRWHNKYNGIWGSMYMLVHRW